MNKRNRKEELLEMLKDGKSAEGLARSFREDLNAATEEYDKWAKEQTADDEDEILTLDEAREELIYAIMDYMYALGILDEDDIEDEVEANEVYADIEQMLLDSEAELTDDEEDNDTLPDPDLVIRAFIRAFR